MAKRKKRAVPEVNASSVADIAFLLLIFFLATTTMETQTGIFRKLPPLEDKDVKPPKIEERNLMTVLVNKFDQIQINGEEVQVKDITRKAREFVENKGRSEDMPEIRQEYIEGYGEAEVSKAVISLQNDRGTTYEVYIAVQDALATAFEQLREERAKEVYGKSYNQLIDDKEDDKIDVIKRMVPLALSEAEPKNVK